MSRAPHFTTMCFEETDGEQECWWCELDEGLVTDEAARAWCADNGIEFFVMGRRYWGSFGFGKRPFRIGRERYLKWIGFVFEEDAMMFYMRFA